MVRALGFQALIYKNAFVLFAVGLQFNRRWPEVWISVGCRSLIIGRSTV